MLECVSPPCPTTAVCEVMETCGRAGGASDPGPTEQDGPAPRQWVVLEVFGHRRHVGVVSQVERYGTVMCRLDVPGEDGTPDATFFYGGSAIFSETPVTEERGRQLLAGMRGIPTPDRIGWQEDDDFDDPEC